VVEIKAGIESIEIKQSSDIGSGLAGFNPYISDFN
jgi:hypothetical protein